jgi:hypothetical protein
MATNSEEKITLGILKEFRNKHRFYVAACTDLGVPYQVVDISGPDWTTVVRDTACAGFLVHPSAKLSIWKQMYDERLRVMVQDFGKIIYPSYEEIWLYESKRRTCYWLEANEVPHPATRVFYSREAAWALGRTVELPVVAKSDFGSAASGVKIFRRRLPLLWFLRKCFGKGFVPHRADRRDRQWGSILLQEYLPDAIEWRAKRAKA